MLLLVCKVIWLQVTIKVIATVKGNNTVGKSTRNSEALKRHITDKAHVLLSTLDKSESQSNSIFILWTWHDLMISSNTLPFQTTTPSIRSLSYFMGSKCTPYSNQVPIPDWTPLLTFYWCNSNLPREVEEKSCMREHKIMTEVPFSRLSMCGLWKCSVPARMFPYISYASNTGASLETFICVTFICD